MFGTVTCRTSASHWAPRLTAASPLSGPTCFHDGINSRATNGKVTNASPGFSPGVAKMIFKLWFRGNLEILLEEKEQSETRSWRPGASQGYSQTTAARLRLLGRRKQRSKQTSRCPESKYTRASRSIHPYGETDQRILRPKTRTNISPLHGRDREGKSIMQSTRSAGKTNRAMAHAAASPKIKFATSAKGTTIRSK